jgi:hypothetical protein
VIVTIVGALVVAALNYHVLYSPQVQLSISEK